MSSSSTPVASTQKGSTQEWSATVHRYKCSDLRKSVWQLVNTFLPLAGLCWLMYWSYGHSYLLTLLLAIPTAGFLVRVFIIQHDCGHHSFFNSHRANDWLGTACSFLTLTPYHFWRRTHSRHHTTSGNLAHRGHGDVLTLTVDEYLGRSRWGRLAYRLYRHPAMMFGLGACYLFLISHRLTYGLPKSWRRERISIHVTSLGVLAGLALGWWTIGLAATLSLWLPVIALAAASGTFLFFVQHQYEEAYWQPHESWDVTRAALEGSSYYCLPPMLQWFTGNIGFHHIHHLNSRIPNYHLPACYAAEPAFRRCHTLGVWQSLKCTSLKLWDTQQQKMVGFAEAHATKAVRAASAAKAA